MSVNFFKARALSEFDIGKKYREYVINDAWKSNEALWNLISSFAGEASSKIYERMVDMTKNIADVDVCDVKHLESMSYQFGIKTGYKFIDSLPSEVYDMMNVLSVKESYFFRKNGIFSASGIDDIMSYIPDAVSEIADSPDIYDAMIKCLDDVIDQMLQEYELTSVQAIAIKTSVRNEKSLTVGLDKILDNGIDITIEGSSYHVEITASIYNRIKSSVISKLLDSGKISYDDYKSYEIHGNTLKDVYNINIIPASEFKEVNFVNNSYDITYTVNHKIKFGTSNELESYKNNGGEIFSVTIWNIGKSLVESTISNCGIDESTVNYIVVDCMTDENKTFVQALEQGIKTYNISKTDFTKIHSAIQSISYLAVMEDFYNQDNDSTLNNMVSNGIISEEDKTEFKNLANGNEENQGLGFIETAKEFSKYGRFKIPDGSLLWMIGDVFYLKEYANDDYSLKTFQKLPNNSDSIAVFNDEKWMIFENLLGRYPAMKAVENDNIKPSNLVVFNEGSDSLHLPDSGLENWKSVVGISVRFSKVPYYVGIQTYINDMIYKSYYDLIKEKLDCVLHAGNEEDLNLYKEDFLKYVSESGFNQYVDDRNVNFGFYRALVFSHFCSNLYSKRTLIGDWFLDCDLHSNETSDVIDSNEVISEVARALSDMTLAIAIRREIIKKLAIQYSYIGSNYSIEKTIGDFILRNFTERNVDWNFRSNVATMNDEMLPSLADIRKKFSLEVVEYYDNTEYLNISAESAKRKEYAGKGTEWRISSMIDASGQLVIGNYAIEFDIYEDSEIPVVSGGNEPFWTMPDYAVRLVNQSNEIVDFYKHVDGSLESLTSINAISAMAVKMWENCALSSLINENLEMHNKYIGDGTGYMTAVNSGNENYPTIAPLPTITNLTESYGNMERDYQSVLSDDRPDIVEGVGYYIAGSYQYVPVTGQFIGTEAEIIGMPPYLTYPIQNYIRTKVTTEVRQVITQEQKELVIENKVPITTWNTVSGYNTVLSTIVTPTPSTMILDTPVTITSYIASFNDERIYENQYSTFYELSGTYYTLNGNVTQPSSAMFLEQVSLRYTESVPKPNQNQYVDQISGYYDNYISNEEFTNDPIEIGKLSSVALISAFVNSLSGSSNGIDNFYDIGGTVGLGPFNYDVKVYASGEADDDLFIFEGTDPSAYLPYQGFSPSAGQHQNGYVWKGYDSNSTIVHEFDNQLVATIPSGKIFSIMLVDYLEPSASWRGSILLRGIGNDNVVNRSVIDDIYLEYHKNYGINKIGTLSSEFPISTHLYDIELSGTYSVIRDENNEIISSITYGDLVTSYIPEILNRMNKIYPALDYNNIVNYTSAIIDGNITSGIYHLSDDVDVYVNASAGEFMVGQYYSILKNIDYFYNATLEKIVDIRNSFDDKYDTIIDFDGPNYTTLENYNRYINSINASITAANALEDAVSAYDNSPKSYEFVEALSSFSDEFLNSLFGNEIFDNYVDKFNNKIELVVDEVIEAHYESEVSSFIVNLSSQIPVSEYYEYQLSSEQLSSVFDTSTYYVDVSSEINQDVSTEITSYMILKSDEVGILQDITPYLFDDRGGMINSWRNMNVELRGYNTNYEVSPNLTKSYVENCYVDIDGPWIGDALYDLIYEMIEFSDDDVDAIELNPSLIDISKFIDDHRFDYSSINKNHKWNLPEYIEYIGGCNIKNQLRFYLNDIVECRNKTIFEVEVDSFNNQYTLYKNKESSFGSHYDEEGVLWMRHSNFPFSFPIMQKPREGWEDIQNVNRPSTITVERGTYTRDKNLDIQNGKAWDNGSLYPRTVYTISEYPLLGEICKTNDGLDDSKIVDTDLDSTYEATGAKIDQIYLGYTMNYYRSIFNRCLAFGVNNTSLWVAGYDGKNADGSDHFNIRIIQCKYFERNNERYYGNINSRSMNKFNSDPVGYDSGNSNIAINLNDQYKWVDFCGGYYDGNVINFVFYGNSGFRFRVYNLSNARLNNSDIIAEFNTEFDVAETYKPFVDDSLNPNGNNPFRLVEDNYHCYIGWITMVGGKKLVVCQNDKRNYAFESILAWNVPSEELSNEIDSLVAGIDMVKVKFKSGNVYYGRLSEENFSSNEGCDELILATAIKMNYIASDVDDDNPNGNGIVIPRIPIKDITQWRNWSYSLTDNSVNTINYSDVLNVLAETSSFIGRNGERLGMASRMTYIPGNLMDQSIVSYDPYSGISFHKDLKVHFDINKGKYVYQNGDPVDTKTLMQDVDYELTGYEIDKEYYKLTPHLQSIINAYGPSVSISGFIPTNSEAVALSTCYDQPQKLSGYYGLPYNNLYVERTDIERNMNSLIDQIQPKSEYNFLTLKNFYNYNFEHEYNWNPDSEVQDSMVDELSATVVGWRKYNKCSISRYSDSMWLSYNFIRDYEVLKRSNKQQAVARIMNDYEFVEVVYGTIQLMNSNYCKSNVFSIKINNTGLNEKVYYDDTEEKAQMRENIKNQINDEIRSMISNYAPIHTQLWKIEFKN